MPDFQLDNPGEIEWLHGRRPAPVLGPCPHNCKHSRSLVAMGPSFDRYKLVECNGVRAGGGGTECAGRCRAWMDSWGNVVTDWLQVDVDPASVAWSTRLAAKPARPSESEEVSAGAGTSENDELPEPCQPIGCDNGYHLPGCWYAAADKSSPASTPDSSEVPDEHR